MLGCFYRENSFTANLHHQKRSLYGRLQDGQARWYMIQTLLLNMTFLFLMLPFPLLYMRVGGRQRKEKEPIFFLELPVPAPCPSSHQTSTPAGVSSGAQLIARTRRAQATKRAAPPRPPKSLPFHVLLLIKAAVFRSQRHFCVKRMRCQVIFILPINQFGGIVPGKPAVDLLLPIVNLPLFPHHWDSVPLHL